MIRGFASICPICNKVFHSLVEHMVSGLKSLSDSVSMVIFKDPATIHSVN